jgi:hypothetical protein
VTVVQVPHALPVNRVDVRVDDLPKIRLIARAPILFKKWIHASHHLLTPGRVEM